MPWIIPLSLVLIAFVFYLMLPVKIPREPFREGAEDDEAVRAYDRTSRSPLFWMERYIILRALNRDPPRGALLDAGCGPGYLAAKIARRFPLESVIGLDIDERKIRIAENNWPAARYKNLKFIVGDAHHLPFPRGAFDFAVSSLSLHHWSDAPAALAEIYRVLKPGGRFLIFDIRRDGRRFFYWSLVIGQALFAPRVLRRTNGAVGSYWSGYTSTELDKMLSAIPFKAFKLERRFGWLLATGKK